MRIFARSVFTAAAVSGVGLAVGVALWIRGIGRAIDNARWDLDDDDEPGGPEPMLFDPVEDFEAHCARLLQEWGKTLDELVLGEGADL